MLDFPLIWWKVTEYQNYEIQPKGSWNDNPLEPTKHVEKFLHEKL